MLGQLKNNAPYQAQNKSSFSMYQMNPVAGSIPEIRFLLRGLASIQSNVSIQMKEVKNESGGDR